MNPEHRQGSIEQALEYFNEQLGGQAALADTYAALLRNIYNFVMAGGHGSAVVPVKMKNGKTLYLRGEIR